MNGETRDMGAGRADSSNYLLLENRAVDLKHQEEWI